MHNMLQTQRVNECPPAMSPRQLRSENRRFKGRGGTSRENCSAGFVPAFKDCATGRVYRSRFADGRPAPMHLLEGLPAHLLSGSRSAAAAATLVSGFLREGRFYSRAEAAHALQQAGGA
jgi:hypothetical protein